MKQARQHGYKVLGELSPDKVLPFTGPGIESVYFFNHLVKMTSLRYQTFKKSLVCRCCGIKGTVMLLELPTGSKMPHFNLYAEREGQLVQMTKDHINPKSKGGKDHISNMQTLCFRCNELKSNYATKLKRLREIQNGTRTVHTVIYPTDEGIQSMEGFATSDKGVAEIVRRYVVKEYQWQDDFEVRVNIRKKFVEVHTKIKEEPVIFIIKSIRRV